METNELLKSYEENQILLDNLKQSEEAIKIKKQEDLVESLKKQIKDRIRSGEEIEGSEKYEIKKQYNSVWDDNLIKETLGEDLASLYLGSPVTEIKYPDFDSKKLEKDVKDGILPATVLNAKKQWDFKLVFAARKKTDYEM